MLLLALWLWGEAAPAQDEQPAPSNSPYQFVSGSIVDLPAGKIVVERDGLGKTPERHTFTITSATKIEGTLRVQARVTVGYTQSEEGDAVAVRIIVRPPPQAKPR